MMGEKNKERKKKLKIPVKMSIDVDKLGFNPEDLFKEAEKPVGFTKKIIKREKQKLF